MGRSSLPGSGLKQGLHLALVLNSPTLGGEGVVDDGCGYSSAAVHFEVGAVLTLGVFGGDGEGGHTTWATVHGLGCGPSCVEELGDPS